MDYVIDAVLSLAVGALGGTVMAVVLVALASASVAVYIALPAALLAGGAVSFVALLLGR